MASNILVIPHFHWDREWYFTTEESKILLVNDMEEVFEVLENNPDYPCFILDGQTAILEDYLSVKPENKERLQKLTKSGRLIIGPWYTQTDEMVVGQESIVRNLLYGKLDTEKFGPRMNIGYLPDSFGQTARLPQILNGFGINHSIFWRGTSERMGSNKTEFIHKDGEYKVVSQLLPLGYAIGKYLPTDEVALKERLDKYFPVLDKGATTDYILLPNGHDQMPIQKNIFDVMDKIEKVYPERKVKLARYEEIFDKINEENLDVLTGEFLDGKYMRVHRSIYSSRSDIKSMNTRIENKITNILEPLMTIAYSLGFTYEHGLVESIWKEIMKNHAHDSMGCCCSDKVHKEIVNRFFIAEDRLDNLIEFYKRKIVDAMAVDKSLDKLTIFNTLPYNRKEVITANVTTKMKNFELFDSNNKKLQFEVISSEVVDAGLIDRQIVHYGNYEPFIKYTLSFEDEIEAVGYKTYFIKESDTMCFSDSKNIYSLNNNYYDINIETNGSLSILDKKNNKKYHNVLLVEDGSDDGDGYDYSPLENDYVVTSNDVMSSVKVIHHKFFDEAHISYNLALPKDLESRKNHLLDGNVKVDFEIILDSSEIIKVKMIVDNQVKDHRLRVLIPNELGTKFSVADNQFGSIRRSSYDSAMDVWQEENWTERPDGIYPFLSYVHQDVPTGLAFLTNSIREYELIGDNYNTLAITIFRSVGVLGKENLFRRPGRPSGIKMETPDSQLIGIHTYEFALTSNIAEVSRLAKEYITPLVSYNKMPYNAMKLNNSSIVTPYDYSLLSIDNRKVILSVIKKPEKEDGVLVRLYNPGNSSEDVSINTKKDIYLSRLDEKVFTKIDKLKLNENEVKTIIIK